MSDSSSLAYKNGNSACCHPCLTLSPLFVHLSHQGENTHAKKALDMFAEATGLEASQLRTSRKMEPEVVSPVLDGAGARAGVG